MDLVLAILLFGGIASDQFILILFQLVLPGDKSALFVVGQDHVCLRLVLLLLNNTRQFFVLFDHFLDNGVDLFFFRDVLLVGFGPNFLLLLDLTLNKLFVIDKV